MSDIAEMSLNSPDPIADFSDMQAVLLAWGAQLDGELVLPSHTRFAQDRKLFNPAFDPHPCAVMYCESEQDVRECLHVVERLGLEFTIRSGGHSTAGYSAANGKLLIDLSRLNQISVNVLEQTAVAGTGVSFGELNTMLDTYDLHVPGGECDDVCIGGFVQGGGYGFTSRTFGMNCDNVIAMRVMLADGSIVNADAIEHPDLWWAMRGGTGGNFGILLAVSYRLHKLSELCGWALAWPLTSQSERNNAAAVLSLLQRSYMRSGAPNELNSQVMICYQTYQPDISEASPWLLVRGTYLGTVSECESLLQPLISAQGCQRQYVKVDRYLKINAALLKEPLPIPQFDSSLGRWPCQRKKARYISRDLDGHEWRRLLDFYVTTPNAMSYMCIEVYGGAINAAPQDLNAFIHRDVSCSISLGVFWGDPADQPAALQFLEQWCEVMEPFWNGHIYQNYPSLDTPNYRWNYWGHAFDRLLSIKKKYDPANKFTFPQMIKPSETDSIGFTQES